MNMVSGYRDYYPLDYLTKEMTRPTTPDAVISEYAKQPLDFEPGARWSYSNTNYLILGRIVEKVSGKSYEDFLQERILRPLGMILITGWQLRLEQLHRKKRSKIRLER